MEALKCEMCGGELALDALNDLYLCEYCGTKYPRVTATEEVPPESPAEEEAQGIPPVDKLIQNGRTMLELGDYAKASAFFRQATTHYPEDYRGWWYTFVCDTKSMTAIRPDKDMFYKTRELEYAFRVAPEDVQPDLLRQYRAFAGQCMKKGCEIEIAKLVDECNKIDADIATHEAALATGEKSHRKAMEQKGAAVFLSILCVVSIIIMFISFFRPSLWMFLTIPLGLFGILMLIGTRLNFSKKEIEEHAKEKARLTALKTMKLVYLDKLNKYLRDLPAMMERLTIADVLKQEKYVA